MSDNKFDTWESYYYPDDPLVLRNKPGIRDFFALRDFDYRSTFARRVELEVNPQLVARTFNAEHVKAIHAHLFQDVYEWAGEYRTVNMQKAGGLPFADVQSGQIDQYLGDVAKLVARTDWAQLDHSAFAERIAEVFAFCNQAHPMREGNGRTVKVLLDHVAERSAFRLEFERVPADVWNLASATTRPLLDPYRPEHQVMVPVFEVIAVQRGDLLIHEGGRVTTVPDVVVKDSTSLESRLEDRLEKLRAQRAESAPKPGTEATRKGPGLDGGAERTGRSEGYGKRSPGVGR